MACCSSRPPSRLPTPLLVVLLGLVAWSAWFIYRSSFVVRGRRYFCLFDDAMISLAYARNFAEGFGLNWARWGEPVEGFSSPLWTFLMIPVHLLPLDLKLRPLAVQLMGLVCLLLLVWRVQRLASEHFSAREKAAWLPAAVLTATYYPLSFWSLIGMESGLQALLTVLAIHLCFDIVERHRTRQVVLCLVLALAYLLRMDMALMIATVVVFIALTGGFRRRDSRRWIVGLSLLVTSMVGLELWRWLYFHDLLPNTYYLKLSGVPLEVRWLRGLKAYTDFLHANLGFLLLLGIGALFPRRHARKVLLPVSIFGVYSLYSIYVGGDAWELDNNVRANRFLAFTIPPLFAIFGGALSEFLNTIRNKGPQGLRSLTPVLATVLVFLTANGLIDSDQAEANWRNVAVTDRPLLVSSHVLVVRDLRSLQELVEPDAVVAAFWAGIPAYYSDFRMVDILGYNDRIIAHIESPVPLGSDRFELYTPGHMKWDYDHTLGVLHPDALLQVWGIPLEQRPKVLGSYGYEEVEGFWLRTDSTKLK